MERDVKKVAEVMARSFASNLRAFIFSRNLIDENIVEDIVKGSGISSLISKWSKNDIIVYYIRTEPLERECMYSECSGEKGPAKNECVRKCLEKSLAKAAKAVAKSILEYSI
ncbi:MAG: hypothetical protein F7B17_06160 [Desulfurococcales archaeon]|nr:hypothetical protein [Desulfurococcales archaeon]